MCQCTSRLSRERSAGLLSRLGSLLNPSARSCSCWFAPAAYLDQPNCSGPPLTNFGTAGALADPALTIYQDKAVISTIKGWANSASITTAPIQTGAFPLPSGSKDVAVLITLNPGVYTAQIKSAKSASSGVALIAIYEVP